jgi:hypothetical protein
MKPSLPPKPAGWSNASNGTTPPSTAAGSIRRSPSSASYRPNASTDASPTNKPSSTKGRLAARPQFPMHQSQLALHNRQRTHQTQAAVPFTLTESGD